MNFCRLLCVLPAWLRSKNTAALRLICATASFSTPRATRRGGGACGVIVLHACTTSVSVSGVSSLFRGFAAKPHTGKFADVVRCYAARGIHRTYTDAVRKWTCRCWHSARQNYRCAFSVTAAHTVFPLCITARCAAVYGNSSETQLIRGESASGAPATRVPIQLKVLEF